MLLIHLRPREKDASFLSPFRRQSSPKLLLVKMVILNTKALLIHVSSPFLEQPVFMMRYEGVTTWLCTPLLSSPPSADLWSHIRQLIALDLHEYTFI